MFNIRVSYIRMFNMCGPIRVRWTCLFRDIHYYSRLFFRKKIKNTIFSKKKSIFIYHLNEIHVMNLYFFLSNVMDICIHKIN